MFFVSLLEQIDSRTKSTHERARSRSSIINTHTHKFQIKLFQVWDFISSIHTQVKHLIIPLIRIHTHTYQTILNTWTQKIRNDCAAHSSKKIYHRNHINLFDKWKLRKIVWDRAISNKYSFILKASSFVTCFFFIIDEWYASED